MTTTYNVEPVAHPRVESFHNDVVDLVSHELMLDYCEETANLNKEGYVDYMISLRREVNNDPLTKEAFARNGLLPIILEVSS